MTLKVFPIPPSNFIAGRLKAALLFCLLLVVLLARCIPVVSVVYICLIRILSIQATCPSIPAARLASRLYFIRFVFVVRSCFVW